MQRASALLAARTLARRIQSTSISRVATARHTGAPWKAVTARLSTNTASTGSGAPGFNPQLVARNQALDGWRVRRLIVEAGANHQRLLAVLGEAMERLDPHNAAIAVGRLAQAAKAQPGAAGQIASDERFHRLVAALHAQAANLPPHHLGSVVEALEVFGVKMAGV